MKTENIIENRDRFFALYWGTETFCGGDNHMITNVDPYAVSDTSYPEPHLRLKSILHATQGILLYLASHDGKNLDNVVKCEVLSLERHNNKEYLNLKLHCINGYHSYIHTLSSSQCVDFLRYNGYAVGWLDLSVEDLVDYGWIKILN